MNDCGRGALGENAGDGVRVRYVGVDWNSAQSELRVQMTTDESLTACYKDRASHGARP